MDKQESLLDVPLLLEEVEKALLNYEISPQFGLDKLQAALSYLSKKLPADVYGGLLVKQFMSLEFAINRLVAAGAPYLYDYHCALLSSIDAFSQIIYSNIAGEDRSQQYFFLLSAERSCWSVLGSLANNATNLPDLAEYEAYFESAKLSYSLEALLTRLGDVGVVSFHVTSTKVDFIEKGGIQGRITLKSVQSMAWLKTHYPMLNWKRLLPEKKNRLRELCEVSYLPLFQHEKLDAGIRSNLLKEYETQLKELYYYECASSFPLHPIMNTGQQNEVCKTHRSVPLFGERGDERDSVLEIEKGCIPVRHGGAFYSALVEEELNQHELKYTESLGRDFLSSFLYEFELGVEKIVFDCEECLSFHTVSMTDVIESHELENSFVVLDNGYKLPLVRHLLGVDVFKHLKVRLTDKVFNVVLVEQVGKYFALPYLSKREIEAVPAFMQLPQSWVKNVWQVKDGGTYFEPWLFSIGRTVLLTSIANSSRDRIVAKNGYYTGCLYGKNVWIEADLVLALVSSLDVDRFNIPNSGVELPAFVIYQGRCFDQVVIGSAIATDPSNVSSVLGFSIILEWQNQSIVLPFRSCNWYASLPSERNIEALAVCLPNSSDEGEELFFSLQEESFVINKNNFISFVGGIWPPALSIERKG